eukprot:12890523-Prorocentrum_lima.AAC.1
MAERRAAGGRARCMRSNMAAMSPSSAALRPGELSGQARRRLRFANWRASCPGGGRAGGVTTAFA